ncbi:DUF1801 domain-containing protein [Jiangella asiatica]|uniref:DUF1801 domain-containing protein n=1 Tax=Jiangella asiatica TaxID=2530372 RepID=A0A4R5CH75_9ACTN|nr:DUF1801 domain-containing protein [Jiangella asiatica]TDD99085.1 DUF1801 domain-containing protein [Jiangella asiatica]
MTDQRGIDAWLERLPPDRQDEATALADQVRKSRPGLDEAVKWGRLTFTAGDDWHHWLCAVAATKRSVTLTFHKGVLLDDPAGLLEGSGAYVRTVPYARAAAEPDAVAALIGRAVERQTDMLDEKD